MTRRYLVRNLLGLVPTSDCEYKKIIYMSENPLARMIKKGPYPSHSCKFFITNASDADGHDKYVGTYDRAIDITEEMFDYLRPIFYKMPKLEIYSTFIPTATYTYKVNQYLNLEGGPKNLSIAEVDFESDMEWNSFVPPAWFGPETTLIIGFEERNLAKFGVPTLEEINKYSYEGAAIQALLDEIKKRRN